MDGDGCIRMLGYANASPLTKRVSLTAANNSKRPLEELQRLYGGSLKLNCITSAGNEHWQWSLTTAADVRSALEHLLPHLVEKKELAAIVYAFTALVGARGHRRFGEDEKQARAALIVKYDEVRHQYEGVSARG
jgi:hypothetical protein